MLFTLLQTSIDEHWLIKGDKNNINFIISFLNHKNRGFYVHRTIDKSETQYQKCLVYDDIRLGTTFLS